MDLHWLAGVAVLLILVAVSAYREALENDRAMRFGAIHGDRSAVHDAEQAMERV
ncbi:hypothetical protein LJR230_004590 [Trinickia sp. LjRoot230]|uniref:hypothetical protein n=1 Tax=Trinickia sp. LjRoot230 TaxID=3342288 RepID=UPI003ECEFD3D